MKINKICVTKVVSKEELKEFVQLPKMIYQNDANWPGQDDDEVFASFIPESNVGLKYMEIQPFIGKKEDVVVGRICGIICPAFNQHWAKAAAFFGYFESINDQEVASQLFEAVKQWALERNCSEILGPLSPDITGTVGFLVNKFDKRPTYGYAYNPDYYPELCQNFGFVKEKNQFVNVFTFIKS